MRFRVRPKATEALRRFHRNRPTKPRQRPCRRGAACSREANLAGGAVAGASPLGVSSNPPSSPTPRPFLIPHPPIPHSSHPAFLILQSLIQNFPKFFCHRLARGAYNHLKSCGGGRREALEIARIEPKTNEIRRFLPLGARGRARRDFFMRVPLRPRRRLCYTHAAFDHGRGFGWDVRTWVNSGRQNDGSWKWKRAKQVNHQVGREAGWPSG